MKKMEIIQEHNTIQTTSITVLASAGTKMVRRQTQHTAHEIAHDNTEWSEIVYKIMLSRIQR